MFSATSRMAFYGLAACQMTVLFFEKCECGVHYTVVYCDDFYDKHFADIYLRRGPRVDSVTGQPNG